MPQRSNSRQRDLERRLNPDEQELAAERACEGLFPPLAVGVGRGDWQNGAIHTIYALMTVFETQTLPIAVRGGHRPLVGVCHLRHITR